MSGLQSNHVFHYRLIAVNQGGDMSAGADQSFVTVPSGRLNPIAVAVSVSPVAQRRLPDIGDRVREARAAAFAPQLRGVPRFRRDQILGAHGRHRASTRRDSCRLHV